MVKEMQVLFSSARSCGATSVAINFALLQQQLTPDERVGVIQCTQFPDLHFILGQSQPHPVSKLLDFLNTDEKTPQILSRVCQKYIVDTYHSAPNDWSDVESSKFKILWDLLCKNYDHLFIDLHASFPKKLKKIITQTVDHQVLITTLDPASLEATNILSQQSPEKAFWILGNQGPKNAYSPKALPANARWLGSLPWDEKPFWDQSFQGLPVALHRKSKWKSALQEILIQLQSL